MTIDEVLELDAVGQAALLAAGEVRTTELVDAAIARAERVNPELNAIIIPAYDRAVDRARSIEEGGGDAGPGRFGGVPMATKDLECREQGLPFHEGSRFLKDEIGWTAPDDQELTVRFAAAGLVSIGRTNTSEFGLQVCCEPIAYGPTHNPWRAGTSPGGSSGGSAAAVAAGIVAVAHASDAGGSIRIPASFCGLVGLKPSRHRSPQGPDFGDVFGGLGEELCLSRSVRDTAAVFDAVTGPDPGAWAPSWPLPGPLEACVGADPGRLRIGVWAAPAPATAPATVDPRVADVVRDAARLLDELGHDLDDDHPAALEEDVSAVALAHYGSAAAWVCDHHWPRVTGYGRPIPDELLEPTALGLREIGRATTGPALLEARELAQLWNRRMAAWWVDHDLLVLPTVAVLPPAHGTTDELAVLALTLPMNLSGQPAISLPLGTVDGLPVGVQLVAAHGREDVLIRVASQLEAARPWAARRPPPG